MHRDVPALVVGLVLLGFGALTVLTWLGRRLPELPFAVVLVAAGVVGLIVALGNRPDRR